MRMNNKGRGRPPSRQAKLMDGFYVEVRNKGSHTKGVIIRNATRKGMEDTVEQYKKHNKDVIVLGEHKNFEWLSEEKQKVTPAGKSPKSA